MKEGPASDLVIEVADNGPGIPDERLRLVFEPFFSTKGSMGTGLGLAVTRKTVQEHAGDITVSRSPEGGALFRIVLPDAGRKPERHG
jgi:signal transduction histidine kinase